MASAAKPESLNPSTLIGSANGPDVLGAETLPSEVDLFTFATSVMGMDESGTPNVNPEPSSFATDTPRSLTAPMEMGGSPTTPSLGSPSPLETNLSGYVLQGWQRITVKDLASLGSAYRDKLFRLAEGRGEPVEYTVYAIASFFLDSDELCASWPLKRVLEFYLDTQVY